MFKSVVKVCGSTVKLQLILDILSAVEAGGIRGVAVKCLDITKNSDCEGSLLSCVTDADARKCGYQTGLDTLVVHTVNDEYSLLAIYCQRLSESIKYSTWGVRRQR